MISTDVFNEVNFSVVTYRKHGQRTPDFAAYPKNPYKHLTFQPFGRGQLINKGKQLTYQLGQSIRTDYKEFIDENYYPGVLKATCTAYDRTKASLQLFMAGLFPPKGPLVWNSNLVWQPIPYTCLPISEDKLFHASVSCKGFIPAYKELHDKMDLLKKYRHVYKQIERHSGRKINTTFDIYEIYFDMAAEKEWGLDLPDWAVTIFPEPVTHLATMHYKITCGTPFLRRCTLQSAFEKIIRNTVKITRGQAKIKLYVYSCHELNIAQFLIGLDSFTHPHVPDYCSCLILEVHRVDNEHFVKGLYKPNLFSDVKLLHMWGKNPCSLTEFVSLIKSNFK